jgi:hypothetical protein
MKNAKSFAIPLVEAAVVNSMEVRGGAHTVLRSGLDALVFDHYPRRRDARRQIWDYADFWNEVPIRDRLDVLRRINDLVLCAAERRVNKLQKAKGR